MLFTLGLLGMLFFVLVILKPVYGLLLFSCRALSVSLAVTY